MDNSVTRQEKGKRERKNGASSVCACATEQRWGIRTMDAVVLYSQLGKFMTCHEATGMG